MHTWYVNESIPVNPGRGVYVYVPFEFHDTVPFAGLDVCVNTDPAGYVSFAAAFTLTGTSICVVAESFTASGPTTIVSVAAEQVALFGAARHTWYRNESTPENPVRGVYVYDPFGFHATDPFAGLVT